MSPTVKASLDYFHQNWAPFIMPEFVVFLLTTSLSQAWRDFNDPKKRASRMRSIGHGLIAAAIYANVLAFYCVINGSEAVRVEGVNEVTRIHRENYLLRNQIETLTAIGMGTDFQKNEVNQKKRVRERLAAFQIEARKFSERMETFGDANADEQAEKDLLEWQGSLKNYLATQLDTSYRDRFPTITPEDVKGTHRNSPNNAQHWVGAGGNAFPLYLDRISDYLEKVIDEQR